MEKLVWYSDDPAADADRYYGAQENREHYVCDRCGAYIYKADSLHEADRYCRLDGKIYCKSCIDWALGEFGRRHRKEQGDGEDVEFRTGKPTGIQDKDKPAGN